MSLENVSSPLSLSSAPEEHEEGGSEAEYAPPSPAR